MYLRESFISFGHLPSISSFF